MDASYDLFISYKSENANFVRAFAEHLAAAGLRVWFAEYLISLEEFDDNAAIQRAINTGIRESRYAVIFTNDRWADSHFCRIEIEQILAQYDQQRILEIQTPPTLKPHHYWPALKEVVSTECPDQAVEAVRFLGGLEWFEQPVAEATMAPPAGPQTERSFRYGVRMRVGPLKAKRLGPMKMAHSQVVGERYWLLGEINDHLVSMNINVNPYFNILHAPEYLDTNTLDDRDTYRRLRLLAKKWLTGQNQQCCGVHLFWQHGRGRFCLSAADENVTDGFRYWERRYLLPLRQVKGRGGELQIAFAVRLPADAAAARHEFAKLTPFFDSVAHSVRLVPLRPHFNGELVRHAIAKMLFFLIVCGIRRLMTWPEITGDYEGVATALADMLVGAVAIDGVRALVSSTARYEIDGLGMIYGPRTFPLPNAILMQIWNLLAGGAFMFSYFFVMGFLIGLVLSLTVGLPVVVLLAVLFFHDLLPIHPIVWLLLGGAVYGLGYWGASLQLRGKEFHFLDNVENKFLKSSSSPH